MKDKKKMAGMVRLKREIEKYFFKCEEEDRPPCIAGLANAAGMSKERILSCVKGERHYDIINSAKGRVFQALEERVIDKGNSGALFLLKNYGYSDKVENGDGNITVEFNIPRPSGELPCDIKAIEDYSYED